jgi:probable F420-dependent oxidoreductase
MKAGIMLPHLGQNATRENVEYVAKEGEKQGLDSLWVLERLLAPVKPQTPYVASPDGSLPAEYQNVLDPLTTLTYVAGITERITLGTSIIDMLFHNPIVLAKSFATLDVLSRGRTIAGFGLGWSKDEYDASGIPFKNRGAQANEFLQVLRRAWTDDVVEFKGKFYNIPASRIGPKPVQKPHIPIILGGFSPNAFSRVAKYANGWMPIAGFGPLEQIEQAIGALKEAARQENKDPSKVQVVVLTYPNLTETALKERAPMSGTMDQIGSDVKRFKEMDGVAHIIFSYAFSPIGRDVKQMIDVTVQLAKYAR